MTRLKRCADRALVLPLLTLLLLCPPLLLVFSHDTTLTGVPLLYAYAFTVWALAIVAGALVSRRLLAAARAAEAEETAHPGGRAGGGPG
ncbi:hypothetical protein [Roseospirillum parvum]|uniref:DUF3311 domain-containing protein n=1 Tax=Roseospirillum parvum TaxID=83401 RepID=A0A1G7WT19_9PROT|nr:hypothetical protein [Roseospirillum parvum]SDG75058.1 hypothetical protein SAMN05421742_102310 [Roseospirillum parvum]